MNKIDEIYSWMQERKKAQAEHKVKMEKLNKVMPNILWILVGFFVVYSGIRVLTILENTELVIASLSIIVVNIGLALVIINSRDD
jgi:hypothetical protein